MYFAELNIPKNHVYLFKPHLEFNCHFLFESAYGLWYNCRTFKETADWRKKNENA